MSVDAELAQLAAELEGIAERLADLALECLRAAVDPEDPDPGGAATERRVTRARRAVERAAGLLGSGGRPGDPGDGY